MNTRRPTTAEFIVGSLGLGLVLVAVWLFLPSSGTVNLNFTVNQSKLHFSLTPYKRLVSAECVDVVWQVDGIKQVFLNNGGIAGSGEQQLCYTSSPATFKVVFQDGRSEYYNLTSEITSENTVYWLIAGVGFGLIFIAYAMYKHANLSVFDGIERIGMGLGSSLFLYLIVIHLIVPTISVPTVELNASLVERATVLDNNRTHPIAVSRKLTEITPPNSVFFVPLGVISASALYPFAYPRIFLFAGDLRNYMKTYLGNPTLSFVTTAFSNAQQFHLSLEAPHQSYLLISPSMLDKVRSLDSGKAIDLGQPNLVLWQLSPSVTSDKIDKLMSAIQSAKQQVPTEDDTKDN